MQSSSDPETFNSEHWAKPNPEPLADAQPAKKKANFSIRQRCGDLEYYGSRDWMNASNAARHVSSRRGKASEVGQRSGENLWKLRRLCPITRLQSKSIALELYLCLLVEAHFVDSDRRLLALIMFVGAPVCTIMYICNGSVVARMLLVLKKPSHFTLRTLIDNLNLMWK